MLESSASGKECRCGTAIDRGCWVDGRDGDEKSPLRHSALSGDIALVRFYVEQRQADLEAKDRHGRTPLFEACRAHRHEVINFLLDRGASPHTLDQRGLSPVHILCHVNTFCPRAPELQLFQRFFDEFKFNPNSSAEPLLPQLCSHYESDDMLQIIDLFLAHGVDASQSSHYSCLQAIDWNRALDDETKRSVSDCNRQALGIEAVSAAVAVVCTIVFDAKSCKVSCLFASICHHLLLVWLHFSPLMLVYFDSCFTHQQVPSIRFSNECLKRIRVR